MLVFLIPLQSRAVSKEWLRVSALLRRTLRSVLNQTAGAFRVILICNETPEGLPVDKEHLIIVREDFPLPSEADFAELDSKRKWGMLDKWTKITRGLVEARRFAPCHVMVVDADDCVSSRLAAFVETRPEAEGWYFDREYVHDEGTKWLIKKRDFYRFCGTSSIIRCTNKDLPAAFHGYSNESVIVRAGHTGIRDEMPALGRPLQALPFPGAVYITGTSENHSGLRYSNSQSRRLWLAKILNSRRLTERRRREFGLWPLRDAQDGSD